MAHMERAATATQRLADALLGDDGPLEVFVRSRREAGKSWRQIERDLYQSTDGGVDVTYETIRTWFPDAERKAS